MRKQLIFAISGLAVVLIGIGLWSYSTSHHAVTITFSQSGLNSAAITQSGKSTSIATLKGTGTISLSDGNYFATPAGTNINDTPISFKVAGKSLAITLHPGYSADYLASLLPSQATAISTALLAKYPSITSGFRLGSGQLYLDGQWYAATLIQNPPHPHEFGDVYRVAMQKTGATWVVAAPPQLVISGISYPNIPATVLKDINKKSGY